MMGFGVATLLAVQSSLLVLDVWDYRNRCRSGHGEPPSVSAAGFLLVTIVVYLAIQVLGGWLMPEPMTTVTAARHFFAQSLDSPDEPPGRFTIVALAVISFYLAGFWDYLIHRYLSHHPWFWFTHEYHHVPREVSVFMPGILTRPFAFVPNFLTLAATAGVLYGMGRLFGWPAWEPRPLLTTLLVIVFVLTASHSSWLRRWPWVHHVMRFAALTTPHEHVLHHAAHLEGNYGNFTTLWDRLGGTYLNPSAYLLDQVPLGLAYDQDFFGALTAAQWKLPDRLRDRFEVGRFCRLAPARPTASESSAPNLDPENSDVAD